MCDQKKYFAFGFSSDGEVSTLLGIVNKVPDEVGSYKPVHEVISLPRAFMMGRKFRGQVLTSPEGRRAIAYIDVEAHPLAL